MSQPVSFAAPTPSVGRSQAPNIDPANYGPAQARFQQAQPAHSPSLQGRVAQTTPEDPLLKLVNHITEVRSQSYGVKDKEVVLVIGNTGSGKSTLMNYMAGKTLRPVQTQLGPIVECDDPICKIGSFVPGVGDLSCTTIPQAYTDPHLNLTLCDCPGFFDNRTFSQQIINAVGLRSLAEECKQVKCLLLCMEFTSLLDMRGANLVAGINKTKNFLVLDEKEEAIFLLITKTPSFISPEEGLKELAARYPQIGELHKKGNVGFFSALNDLKQHPLVFNRHSLAEKLKSFRGISKEKNSAQKSPFQVALEPEATAYLSSCIDFVQQMVVSHIKSGSRNKDDLHVSAADISNLFALQQLLETPMMSMKLKALEEAVSAQIRLLGLHDDMQDALEDLKGILPDRFHETIKLALQEIERRIKQNLEVQKTQERLTVSETQIKQIEIEKQALNKQLEEQKISAEEHKKQILKLQELTTQRDQESQSLKKEMERLKQEQQEERERRRRDEGTYKEKMDGSLGQLLSLLALTMPRQTLQGGDCPHPFGGMMGGGFPGMGMGGGFPEPQGFSPIRGSSSSYRTIHVRPYTRSDGTHVRGHTRSIKK